MPSSGDNDLPILLPEKMAELRGLGVERSVLQQLFDTFMAQANELSRALQAAALAKDSAAIRRIAHTMKGASANLGAREMTDLSGRLEELGKSASLDGALELSDRLRAALAQVSDALKSELEKEA